MPVQLRETSQMSIELLPLPAGSAPGAYLDRSNSDRYVVLVRGPVASRLETYADAVSEEIGRRQRIVSAGPMRDDGLFPVVLEPDDA